jgi:hypothetical protein
MIQIAAFWKKESKNGRTYYTGKMGNGRLLLFLNKDKKFEKGPDVVMYVVEDKGRERENGGDNKTQEGNDLPF